MFECCLCPCILNSRSVRCILSAVVYPLIVYPIRACFYRNVTLHIIGQSASVAAQQTLFFRHFGHALVWRNQALLQYLFLFQAPTWISRSICWSWSLVSALHCSVPHLPLYSPAPFIKLQLKGASVWLLHCTVLSGAHVLQLKLTLIGREKASFSSVTSAPCAPVHHLQTLCLP